MSGALQLTNRLFWEQTPTFQYYEDPNKRSLIDDVVEAVQEIKMGLENLLFYTFKTKF